ncbi:MAG: adenosine deaminase [Anaerolineales bacterium]|nr:adenosine deaminase [Anaerolineales bacterium]
MTLSNSWHEQVPKAELHLHLEGAIPYPALWELIRKYGGDPSVPSLEALTARFAFRDFPHFIETWVWKNSFLREYDDFTLFSEAVARDLALQNVRYAEVFYSPPDFTRHGLTPGRLTEAIRAGLGRVPEVEISLIADMVRDFGPEQALKTLEQVAELGELGVIGIGLGGSEQAHPPEPFREVYTRARALGLHTTAHAGEAAGAESIRAAVEVLQTERIGHATRLAEDAGLLAALAVAQIPLEMCPLSNVRTGVVASIEAHPVRNYFEAGLLVTINTDDPKMFGNSLAGEYRLLEERLGFNRDEIRALILNALRASWMPDEKKLQIEQNFQVDPAWLDQHP